MSTVVVVGTGTAADLVADEVVRQGGRAVLLRDEGASCALPSDGIGGASSGPLAVQGAPGKMKVVTDEGEIECSAVILVSDLEASPPEDGTMPLSVLLGGHTPKGTVVLDLRGGPHRGGRARALRAIERILDDGGRAIVLVDEVLAYGRDELLYRQVQQAGALFIRPRAVEWDGRRMEVIDDLTGATVSMVPDAVISESATSERQACRGTVGMGPLTTVRPGVLMVRADLLDDELTTEARAAATIALRPATERARPAEVDQDRCLACLTCVRICPFGAASMDAEGKASIDGDLCRSCGKCVAACAGRAIVLPGSTDQELEARITAAMEGG